MNGRKNVVGLAFAHHCILLQSSTLIIHLYFSSSRSFMFFWRPKERKAPAPAKSVITAFCSRVASDIPRLAVICHKQLFVQASGTKQLAFHAITASHICTAQTYFILFPMLARLFAVILMVPVSLLYYHCTR